MSSGMFVSKKRPKDGRSKRGIDRFGARLPQEVLADIKGWREHPELGKLTRRLDSMADHNRFLDTYAECMVARRLVRHGCELRVEVQTPADKGVDFKATRGDVHLYVHVKRLNLDDSTRRFFRIASSADVLESISRFVKFKVDVLGHEAEDQQIQQFPRQLKQFGQRQQVGATLALPDDHKPVLRVTILPQGLARQFKVNRLFPRYPGPWLREAERFGNPLSRGYKQFMPGSFNLIVVTGYWAADWRNFKKALDDFWSRGQHPELQAAAFFHLPLPDDDEFESRLWLRPGGSLEQGRAQLIRNIFDDQPAE